MALFRKLRNWWLNELDWHRVHRQAWPPVIVPDAEGLTAFQRMARSSLESAIGPIDLQLANDLGNYLVGPLTDTHAVIYIYEGEAEITRENKILFWAEHNAYKCPEELILMFVRTAIELQSNNSFKPTPLRGAA